MSRVLVSVLAFAAGSAIAVTAAAAAEPRAGGWPDVEASMLDVTVDSAARTGPFVCLRGHVKVAPGSTSCATAKATVYVDDFTTRVTPEYTWALLLPAEALSDKVRVRVWQDKTNIVVDRTVTLPDSARALRRQRAFDEVHRQR